LRWVYATLVESAVLAHDCALTPLTPAEREQYHSGCRILASLFGIPPDALPENWEAFINYTHRMHASDELGVNEMSRRMAHNLLAGAGSWLRPPHWYCALTTEWLPERFRSEFELPYSSAERLASARAQANLPRIYKKLPHVVRFNGPWREAQARIAGLRPGLLTQCSNRFWIGQPLLPFA
jgi:uncharacterized protein (DUF2236 family)